MTANLFGSVSEENVARIKRQNARKISVVIGNPASCRLAWMIGDGYLRKIEKQPNEVQTI